MIDDIVTQSFVGRMSRKDSTRSWKLSHRDASLMLNRIRNRILYSYTCETLADMRDRDAAERTLQRLHALVNAEAYGIRIH